MKNTSPRSLQRPHQLSLLQNPTRRPILRDLEVREDRFQGFQKWNQNSPKIKPNLKTLCSGHETAKENDIYQQEMVQMMPRVQSQLFESAQAVLDLLGRISRAPKLQTALDSSSELRIKRFSSRFQVIFRYGRNRGTPNSKFFIIFCVLTDLSQ